MFRVLVSILLLFAFIRCSAQFDVREIDKSLVRINDTLYVSKFEVSNKLYQAFIVSQNNSSQNHESSAIQPNRVDSVRWRSCNLPCEPYVEYYHFHPAFDLYPVVNISHQSAIHFCEWLTKQYNASTSKAVHSTAVFRLPTEQEWILAATRGSQAKYGWGDDLLMDKKGRKNGNFQSNDSNEILAITLESVESSKPNKQNGLHQMSGNVAEMVASSTIVKGGDWMHTSEFLELTSQMHYSGGAEPFVGFRYFMVAK